MEIRQHLTSQSREELVRPTKMQPKLMHNVDMLTEMHMKDAAGGESSITILNIGTYKATPNTQYTQQQNKANQCFCCEFLDINIYIGKSAASGRHRLTLPGRSYMGVDRFIICVCRGYVSKARGDTHTHDGHSETCISMSQFRMCLVYKYIMELNIRHAFHISNFISQWVSKWFGMCTIIGTLNTSD